MNPTMYPVLAAMLEGISFGEPGRVWLLAPVLLLFVFELIRRRERFIVAFVRAAMLSLVVLALMEPIRQRETVRRELAAVVDASYSVSEGAQRALLDQLSRYVDQQTTISVIPFGRQPARSVISLDADGSTDDVAASIRSASGTLDTGETNIGSAISSALARTESAAVFVLSDGFETTGNAADAARAAAQRGVKLHPLLPSSDVFSSAQLSIANLYAPITLGAGDSAEIRASVRNGADEVRSGDIEIWVDQQKLYAQRIEVAAGTERLITVKTPPAKGGLHRIRTVLRTENAARPEERHRWISIKEKSKILLVSGTRDDERLLKKLIAYKGFALQEVVADGSTEVPNSFEGFSSVILNNTAIHQLPQGFLANLEAFAKNGGGVLLVGGDRSFGLGRFINTPLETISPLKFVPPQTEKRRLTNAVMLVIDKSGSMAESQKMDGARDAALLSLKGLKDEDFIGVIGFDQAPFVIIDLKPVGEVKFEAERRLRNLTAAGKTNLLPALTTARQKLQRAEGSRKHIIVLSDGKIPLTTDAYVAEINALTRDGVTISTVALGVDADVPFLQYLSKGGRGAFYHTLDPRQLPQIFIEDIKVATGEKTLQENQDFPVGATPTGVRSTTIDRYPPLRGFVETLPKKGADLELVTRKGEQLFPVLASWRYGLGKVVAFASDANGRWSRAWVPWEGFVKFWSDLIESVKDTSGAKTGDVDFDLRYTVQRKSIVLDLAIFDDKLESQAPPRIAAEIEQPTREPLSLVFRPVKKGRFEARIENGRPGDYRLGISYGSLKLPPLALTIPGDAFGELRGRGVDMRTLEEIALITGGKFNPAPEQVRGQESVTKETKSLVMPVLIAAFLMLLFEAFLREVGLRVRARTPQAVRPVTPPAGTPRAARV